MAFSVTALVLFDIIQSRPFINDMELWAHLDKPDQKVFEDSINELVEKRFVSVIGRTILLNNKREHKTYLVAKENVNDKGMLHIDAHYIFDINKHLGT